MKKPLLLSLVAIILMIAIYVVNSAGLDLNKAKQIFASFAVWRENHQLIFWIIFFTSYVIFVAFSLPISIWMALGAGAIFGFWEGVLIASFASTIGATLAFLASRYFLQDWVTARLGTRARAITDGLEKDGALYLFTLRLIPIVPFFAINLLMGLTKIHARTFYGVSQIGMLPATAVFVNAGTQVAKLDSVGGIISPKLIGSFILLALVPWLAKVALNMFKARKLYARWEKPKSFDRNLVVIGAGAAGLVSSYIGAAVKAKVTLIEKNLMGGDCLNYGCVPSKSLIKSAQLAHSLKNTAAFGVTADNIHIDFSKVMAHVNQSIAAIAPHDSIERYTDLGVDVKIGEAKILDPWRVEISRADGTSEVVTTKSIIVASGAAPFVPPIDGVHETDFLTSDTLWAHFSTLTKAPKRIAVLGGGPIGCELSQALARLGSEVTQIEFASTILGREDPEISEIVTQSMIADGVTILTDHKAVRTGQDGQSKWVECMHKGDTVRVECDELIFAVGRKARLSGFGLEDIGIDVARGIESNEYLQTSLPNIYVAGDVAGSYQFTHTAAHQAWFASVNALFGKFKKFKVDYRVIPWATFVDPEVARVGLNETDAREKGIAIDVTRYDLDDLDRAIIDGETAGFVKVITAKGKDKILGATIVGTHSGELISEFILAMKHGIGLNKILGTIHIYPTMNEANKYAAGNWKRAQTSGRTLKLLERFHGWMRS